MYIRYKWGISIYIFTYNCTYVENALLHKGFSTRIYPGTTQILSTFNVNTRLQSRTLSTPLLMCAISLAIDVNKDTSNYSINASTGTHFTRIQCVTYTLHFQYLLMGTFSYMDNVQYSSSRFTSVFATHIYTVYHDVYILIYVNTTVHISINICTYNCKYNCKYIYNVHDVYLLIYVHTTVHIYRQCTRGISINICTYNCKYNCTYTYSVHEHEQYLLIYVHTTVHIYRHCTWGIYINICTYICLRGRIFKKITVSQG